ncbi:hypothetical protein B0I35DRAFT_422413 [Stachybotrys elegans]|uniref:Uncharacterized protein n=1 Tax=Stachybotrys elegans TaxID=80388 RepID=A0A8K0T4H0_9HYPO|nr:hypothetical protein B0I35DRAFT_422413 [Stachybotrys elegans]
MDSARASGSHSANNAARAARGETPEQLLDVFKAAALSVTKLYKTSALAESRARAEGYQDCLDDLLAFLDKEHLGLSDGEGWAIRRWATEKLDGRDAGPQATESEDEIEKAEATPPSDPMRDGEASQQASTARGESATPIAPSPAEPAPTPTFIVPQQDSFTFQSSHQYPNIATLDLSDSKSFDGPLTTTRSTKSRLNTNSGKAGSRASGHLGRGAGTKRRMDFDEFFGGCLGGKDPFGNGPKRNRHA